MITSKKSLFACKGREKKKKNKNTAIHLRPSHLGLYCITVLKRLFTFELSYLEQQLYNSATCIFERMIIKISVAYKKAAIVK